MAGEYMQKLWTAIRNIGLSLFSLAAFASLLAVLIFGGAWVAAKILPVLTIISSLCLIIIIAVGLPLSLSKWSRNIPGIGFVYFSYLEALKLWLYCLLVVLEILGVFWALIGIILAGIGVIPIAFFTSLFTARWSILIQIIVSLFLIAASRLFAAWLISKSAKAELETL